MAAASGISATSRSLLRQSPERAASENACRALTYSVRQSSERTASGISVKSLANDRTRQFPPFSQRLLGHRRARCARRFPSPSASFFVQLRPLPLGAGGGGRTRRYSECHHTLVTASLTSRSLLRSLPAPWVPRCAARPALQQPTREELLRGSLLRRATYAEGFHALYKGRAVAAGPLCAAVGVGARGCALLPPWASGT